MKKWIIFIVILVGSAIAYFALNHEWGSSSDSKEAFDSKQESRFAGLSFQDRGELILHIKPGAEKLNQLERLGREWATVNPAEALQFRPKIKFPKLRQAWDKGAMPVFSKSDPGFVLEVIGRGEWWQDQWRDERNSLILLAKTEIGDAVSHFTNKTKPNFQTADIARILAKHLAGESMEQALEFGDSLSEVKAKAGAFAGAVDIWVEKDSLKASEWVNSQEHGLIRDYAIEALVSSIAKSDPESAFIWASQIDDSSRKLKQLQKVIGLTVKKGDSSLAEKLISTSSLQESIKIELRLALK